MTSKEIRISDLIIPKFQPLFNDTEYGHHILTSGRAGTKSSYAAVKAVYKVVADDNCAVIVLRKRHNKLRKTVYKEMLRGIKRLGLDKNDFKITKSPMEITYKPNGNTIYFTGSDSIDDTKGIIDEEKPIKLVILDELTEFFDDGEGADELSNIEATFVRGNDEEFQMLYLYNPPKNPNAPIVQWRQKMEKRPDTIHVHADYRDVPVSWLGKKLIQAAELMKGIDEKMYRWVWLGVSIGIDELIYYMFNRDKHVAHERPRGKYVIGIGVDYGQQNPTTYQAFVLDIARKKFKGAGEYYHSGRESGRQKSPSVYAQDFKAFADALIEEFGNGVVYVFIDPSAKGLAEEIKRACPKVRIREADNSVAIGISRVQKLLSYDVLEVSEEQEHLIEECGLYEYNKKSIERGKEEPLKINDHCLDALRYLVMGMWKKLKYFLPVGVRVDDKPDRKEGAEL